MFGLMWKFFKALINIPKDLFVFLKNGNLDFYNICFFVRHPIPIKQSILRLTLHLRWGMDSV